MRHLIATSQEARDLHAALDRSPVAYAYFDLSDRLRFWNLAYVDLNFRIRHIIADGVSFADLLSELVVLGQIQIPDGDEQSWINHRLERRRQGGTDFRHLSDGRSFLVQERHDELGGTLGFWVDVTHLFTDGALKKNPATFSPLSPSLADPGAQSLLREHVQAILTTLELLRGSDENSADRILIDRALGAVGAMKDVLDHERTLPNL